MVYILQIHLLFVTSKNNVNKLHGAWGFSLGHLYLIVKVCLYDFDRVTEWSTTKNIKQVNQLYKAVRLKIYFYE